MNKVGTNAIKDSYQSASASASTPTSKTKKNANKKPIQDAQLTKLNQDLKQIKEKLALIHTKIHVEIDADIKTRAMAISETVAVVQQAVTKMIA